MKEPWRYDLIIYPPTFEFDLDQFHRVIEAFIVAQTHSIRQSLHAEYLTRNAAKKFGDESPGERCSWRLGSIKKPHKRCARSEGHDGEHCWVDADEDDWQLRGNRIILSRENEGAE